MAKTKAQIDRKHKLTLENGKGGVDPSDASVVVASNVFFKSIPLNKPDKDELRIHSISCGSDLGSKLSSLGG